jgi:hypothetical protein
VTGAALYEGGTTELGETVADPDAGPEAGVEELPEQPAVSAIPRKTTGISARVSEVMVATNLNRDWTFHP